MCSLPGDTETQRSQKTLAVIVFVVGAIITALDATNSYFMGLVGLGSYLLCGGRCFSRRCPLDRFISHIDTCLLCFSPCC